MAGAPARAHEDYCRPNPPHVRLCLSSVINCTRVVVSVSWPLVYILILSLHVRNKRLPLFQSSTYQRSALSAQPVSLDFARTCRACISRPSRFAKGTV